MSGGAVGAFAAERHVEDDYLYLLLDPLADCAEESALHIHALTHQLSADGIARVPRLDLRQSPEMHPMLVTLAVPGSMPDASLLAKIEACALADAAYRKRYVCGVIACAAPAHGVVRNLLTLSSSMGAQEYCPIFEPLRLELLAAALRDKCAARLGSLQRWLCPTSWGSFTVFTGYGSGDVSPLPELAQQAQRDADLVGDVLAAWRRALQVRPSYAPTYGQRDTLLPPQAAVDAFRMIRNARALGLRLPLDLIVLSLYRLLFHPQLPDLPAIREEILHAIRGERSLSSAFRARSDEALVYAATQLARLGN